MFEERSQLAQPNRKLSPAEVDQLVARYGAGDSIRGPSRAFDLHEQTVRAHLRRRGVKLRPIRVLSERQIQEAAQLYVAGWSTFRLAARYGVGATTMGVNLKQAGVQLRPRGWYPPQHEGGLDAGQ